MKDGREKMKDCGRRNAKEGRNVKERSNVKEARNASKGKNVKGENVEGRKIFSFLPS